MATAWAFDAFHAGFNGAIAMRRVVGLTASRMVVFYSDATYTLAVSVYDHDLGPLSVANVVVTADGVSSVDALALSDSHVLLVHNLQVSPTDRRLVVRDIWISEDGTTVDVGAPTYIETGQSFLPTNVCVEATTPLSHAVTWERARNLSFTDIYAATTSIASLPGSATTVTHNSTSTYPSTGQNQALAAADDGTKYVMMVRVPGQALVTYESSTGTFGTPVTPTSPASSGGQNLPRVRDDGYDALLLTIQRSATFELMSAEVTVAGTTVSLGAYTDLTPPMTFESTAIQEASSVGRWPHSVVGSQVVSGLLGVLWRASVIGSQPMNFVPVAVGTDGIVPDPSQELVSNCSGPPMICAMTSTAFAVIWRDSDGIGHLRWLTLIPDPEDEPGQCVTTIHDFAASLLPNTGLALSPSGSKIYYGATDLYIYQLDLSTLTSSVFVATSERPDGIACDAAGNVYAVMPTAGVISKITPAGIVNDNWAVPPPDWLFRGTKSLSMGRDGNLYVQARSNLGGTHDPQYTLFKVDLAGAVTQLTAFDLSHFEGEYLGQAATSDGTVWAVPYSGYANVSGSTGLRRYRPSVPDITDVTLQRLVDYDDDGNTEAWGGIYADWDDHIIVVMDTFKWDGLTPDLGWFLRVSPDRTVTRVGGSWLDADRTPTNFADGKLGVSLTCEPDWSAGISQDGRTLFFIDDSDQLNGPYAGHVLRRLASCCPPREELAILDTMARVSPCGGGLRTIRVPPGDPVAVSAPREKCEGSAPAESAGSSQRVRKRKR